jgi:2,5-dichloro-2,5-cyclohexadiene-1,4-diol dehydrogenase 2
VALISGGASGMGEAQAKLFAREGAKVVIGDIQESLGLGVAEAIKAEGGDAVFIRLDVTKEDDWHAAVKVAAERYGKLTTLVNTAGIYGPHGGIETQTAEGWAEVLAVCQTGVFFGMKAAVPELLKTGNAAIVNVSSLLGLKGMPDGIGYIASKGAVRLMSKGAALEYAKRGIRVNTIFPGFIRTPMIKDVGPDVYEFLLQKIPMGRIGEAMDIAYATLYFCSDEARFVTGAELWVDGGEMAG